MRNLSIASTFVALLVGGCGPKTAASLCNQNPPPAACTQSCDSSPGAANTCPAGFHCSPDGTCDSECTPGGNECGANDTCTADGQCSPNGSGSNPGNGPDANCPDVSFTATKITPSIELLIDRSGSMGMNDIAPTRYQAIQTGINTVVGNEQANVYFGAAMFSGDQTPCLNLNGFTVPRALNNATAISGLLAAHGPGGNTPTADAITAITADFMANPPPMGSPPIILLATDGEPNSCTSGNTVTQPSIDATTAAYGKGIRLFILGLAGLNTQFLQDMANAGAGVTTGMPNAPFFTANDPTSLNNALNSIIGGVLSCDLTLSGKVDPTTACDGTVMLNGQTLMCGTDWTVLPDGMTLELQGNACTMFKNTMNPTLTASFPCGSVIF